VSPVKLIHNSSSFYAKPCVALSGWRVRNRIEKEYKGILRCYGTRDIVDAWLIAFHPLLK
jgi:hypothetical protein